MESGSQKKVCYYYDGKCFQCAFWTFLTTVVAIFLEFLFILVWNPVHVLNGSCGLPLSGILETARSQAAITFLLLPLIMTLNVNKFPQRFHIVFFSGNMKLYALIDNLHVFFF